MRHRKKLRKLGVPKDHRKSLLRNLTASLILHGRIRTTKSRAKALAARFGRLMHLVQKKEKREAIRLLPEYCAIPAASRKFINDVKLKYEKRSSGFTRITPVGIRKGDCAFIVQIELI